MQQEPTAAHPIITISSAPVPLLLFHFQSTSPPSRLALSLFSLRFILFALWVTFHFLVHLPTANAFHTAVGCVVVIYFGTNLNEVLANTAAVASLTHFSTSYRLDRVPCAGRTPIFVILPTCIPSRLRSRSTQQSSEPLEASLTT